MIPTGPKDGGGGDTGLDAYTVPTGRGEAEFKEKGSRFLGLVLPATDEASAMETLAGLRSLYPDATHHCWAWRLGVEARERASDDGEPSGTAGPPMLRVLRGSELTEILAVVVRWYGGTKLGKGGLARAYARAVREALLPLPIAVRLVRTEVRLTVSYEQLGSVQRLIHPPELEVVEERYGAEVELAVLATKDRLGKLRELAAALGFDLSLESSTG